MAKIDDRALSAAWQELEGSLRSANKLYLGRADGGRAAAFHQLTAINQFISTVTTNDRMTQMPLFALNVALYYLDLGVVEPMLAPKGKFRRGRRPEEGVLKSAPQLRCLSCMRLGTAERRPPDALQMS